MTTQQLALFGLILFSLLTVLHFVGLTRGRFGEAARVIIPILLGVGLHQFAVRYFGLV